MNTFPISLGILVLAIYLIDRCAHHEVTLPKVGIYFGILLIIGPPIVYWLRH